MDGPEAVDGDLPDTPLRLVVMGVSGAGKTTVATALARRLGATFVDADSLHTPDNVAKMAAGAPLTDIDRTPWLERVRNELGSRDHVVVACSALARAHRDVLRDAEGVRFVFLDLDASAAGRRVTGRTGHFMPANLVSSQYDTLERPAGEEVDVMTVDAHATVEAIVARVIGELPPPRTYDDGDAAH